MENTKKRKIYVASTNEDKLKAVYNAFSKKYCVSDASFIIEVIGISVNSEVKNQPLDYETEEGCYNRMKNLCNKIEQLHEDDIFVSIENGIYNKNKDRAIILIKKNNSSSIYLESEDVTVPIIYHSEIIKYDQNITIGELIMKNEGFPKDNWHQFYEVETRKKGYKNCTRSQIIEEAIITGLDKIL